MGLREANLSLMATALLLLALCVALVVARHDPVGGANVLASTVDKRVDFCHLEPGRDLFYGIDELSHICEEGVETALKAECRASLSPSCVVTRSVTLPHEGWGFLVDGKM